MSVNPYKPPKVKMESPPRVSTSAIEDETLRYTVDFDDIMAFQKIYVAHSPTLRSQRYRLMRFTAIIIAVFCFLTLYDLLIWYRIAVATLAAALGAIAARAILKWSIESQMKKLLREGSHDGIIGSHELRIDEKGLIESTDVNETRHTFSGISRIEETDAYALIYISTFQAHVIPKNRVVGGDVAAFMARLRQLVPNENRRTKS